MKRADVRLARREKYAIFILFFFLNGVFILYIIEFGRLLCPNFDKAWSQGEVAQHTGDDDFWVAIQGKVYDVSNFIHGQHSDISGISSNGEDSLSVLAGQELTGYFPPPLILACPGLVDDPTQQLNAANFTAEIPQAMHTSGSLQSAQNTKLDQSDWYTAIFLPKIKEFYKGPMVWDKNALCTAANTQDDVR